jgi:hypothetical protein
MPVRPSLQRLAAAIAIAMSSRAALADCPPSTIFYGALDPATPIVCVAARVDTVFSTQPCDRLHGRYDVLAGLLVASIDQACPVEAFRPASGIETVIEDDFELAGLAPGTPALLSVVLHLRGEAHLFAAPGDGGGQRLRATLLEGASNSTSYFRTSTSLDRDFFVSEALTLPIAAVAGTPIHLRVAVRAEALDGRAELEGLLEFTGLPPAAQLTSCRGYRSDAPVAARRTSWGRLKAAYR